MTTIPAVNPLPDRVRGRARALPRGGASPAARGSRLSRLDQLLLVLLCLAGFACVATGSVVPVALYAPLFLLVSLRRPELGLAVIFAATPFQNDLSGGMGPVKFSIAEMSLYLITPVMLVKTMRLPRVGPLLIPVCLYLMVCVAASLSDLRGTTLTSIVQMIQYMLLAVAVYASFFRDQPEKMLICFDALVWVGVFMSIMGMATHFEFLGLNKNGWGASISGELIVAVELWFAAAGNRRRQKWLSVAAAVLALGLLMTLSRGGWMAALIGCGVIVLFRRQFKLAIRAALLLVPLIVIGWNLLPQESREYATGFDSSQHLNILARYQSIDYAMAKFRSSPMLGVGVGLRKEYDATNVVLMAMAETGLLGLVTFLSIHVVVLWVTWSAQKPLARADPRYSLAVLGAALVLGRFAHGLVDHYWSRGPILSAWAAVGMATAMYFRPARPLRSDQPVKAPAAAPAIPAIRGRR